MTDLLLYGLIQESIETHSQSISHIRFKEGVRYRDRKINIPHPEVGIIRASCHVRTALHAEASIGPGVRSPQSTAASAVIAGAENFKSVEILFPDHSVSTTDFCQLTCDILIAHKRYPHLPDIARAQDFEQFESLSIPLNTGHVNTEPPQDGYRLLQGIRHIAFHW